MTSMTSNFTILLIALIIVFISYIYFVFGLVDKFIQRPTLKKFMRLPLGALNTALMGVVFYFANGSDPAIFLFLGVLLFAEFFMFHKDTPQGVLFVTLACMIHVMSLKGIVTSFYAEYTGATLYTVSSNPYLYITVAIITLLLLDIAILIVMKWIPADKVKIISQHDEQLWFLIGGLSIFCAYLFYTTRVYGLSSASKILGEFLVLSGIVSLAGCYLLLFFTFKTSALLGYMKENEELHHEIKKEHQYRGAIISDALASFEFNLTTGQVTSVPERYVPVSDMPVKYTSLLSFFVDGFVHEEDRELCRGFFAPTNLLEDFNSGKSELTAEYRVLRSSGDYIWARATATLVRDEETAEIKGFAYLKDIDEDKRRQLELKFQAERDSLTLLYNKGMTGKLIGEYLAKNVGSAPMNALFIIDVDNFKDVNDSLGHTFGDAVLCELAEKLNNVFRGYDIIGRIGGDEFIAFMVNIKHTDIIKTKAAEICDCFRNTYSKSGSKAIATSASIGVAISPVHGRSFEHLYKNADIALYASKNRGKDTFTIYSGEEFSEYKSTRTNIDSARDAGKKSFKTNRIEYVFKMLYGVENEVMAIRSVLELLSKHFEFSRGYIFEASDDMQTFSNTFEWCADGVKPKIDKQQNISRNILDYELNLLFSKGMYFCNDLNTLPKVIRDSLEPQGIKSLLHFAIIEQGQVMGFIGFDDCEKQREFTGAEIDELSVISNVLSTFVIKSNATKKCHQLLHSPNAVTQSDAASQS